MRYLPQYSFWLKLLLCTCLLGHSGGVRGQLPVAGYVVTVAGDTLRGAIRLHDALTQQYQVEFIKLRSSQAVLLDAYQLTSYTYYQQADTFRYVALPFFQKGTSAPTRGFLRQIIGGKVQLYQYRYTKLMPRGASELKQKPPRNAKYPLFGPLSRREADFASERSPYCLVAYQENRPQFEEVNWWNLRKDAPRYFSDHAELAADLRAGRYRARDIQQIIRRYNAWHQTQQTP